MKLITTLAALSMAPMITHAGHVDGSAPDDEKPFAEGARFVTATGELQPLTNAHADVVHRAEAALAGKLSIAADAISVDSVREMTWRDAGLGCATATRAPAPALEEALPGHRVTLRVDGKFHFVHLASQGPPVICDRNDAVAGIDSDRQLVWGPAAQRARADLASRLGATPDDVVLAGARSKRWPDEGLGCEQPGDAPLEAVETDGWILRLRYGNRDYTYHTDLERVFPCPAITAD